MTTAGLKAMFRWAMGLAAIGTLAAGSAMAEDAYYRIPVSGLKITEGKLPEGGDVDFGGNGLQVYITLDGRKAEGFVRPADEQRMFVSSPEQLVAHLRAPQGEKITGRLFASNRTSAGSQVRFEVAPEAAAKEGKADFYTAKAEHYETLLRAGYPGGAWFRHQAQVARIAAGKTPVDPAADQARQFRRQESLEDSYSLFTGGRAVSENLQLDRALANMAPGDETVDVDSLTGVTVAPMDWKPLIKDLNPTLDPLAANIPADQYALFFPSFDALVEVMDQSTVTGLPILEQLGGNAELAQARVRYERQLSVGLSEIARRSGHEVIESVAITGSDPYVLTGTDVAVIFETASHQLLMTYLEGRLLLAQQEPGAEKRQGEIKGVDYSAVVTPDRRICSYVASLADDVIVVTNSMAQLERLIAVKDGKVPPLAGIPEYTFFRDRYKLGDAEESALLVLSDDAIRKWVGPRWRIASSRRTRAAAVLAELQAQNVTKLAKGSVEEGPVSLDLTLFGGKGSAENMLGATRLTNEGVISSKYGSLEFLTPINELALTKVTKTEAEAYERWRQQYQNNWRGVFDPIALRLTTKADRLGADLTVMPLIVGTDYRQFLALTTGASLAPDAADPHPEAVFRIALAINTKSEIFRTNTNIVTGILRNVGSEPFSWLGSWVTLFADDDPFWKELAEAKDQNAFFRTQGHRAPVAFEAEVVNALKLTLFLTSLRAFIEQTAPGLTQWETLEHNKQPYVKISPGRQNFGAPEGFAIYYATLPRAFLITVSQDVLKRALDRHAPAEAGKEKATQAKAPAMPPWQGKNLALQIAGGAIGMVQKAMGDVDFQRVLRERSWSNLPILNEWKRLYPDQDPLAVHERLWKVRLVCPSGGKYVWNDKWQTMESDALGHPGDPKTVAKLPPMFQDLEYGNFGISFEHGGLRAISVLKRNAK